MNNLIPYREKAEIMHNTPTLEDLVLKIQDNRANDYANKQKILSDELDFFRNSAEDLAKIFRITSEVTDPFRTFKVRIRHLSYMRLCFGTDTRDSSNSDGSKQTISTLTFSVNPFFGHKKESFFYFFNLHTDTSSFSRMNDIDKLTVISLFQWLKLENKTFETKLKILQRINKTLKKHYKKLTTTIIKESEKIKDKNEINT